MSVIRLHHKTSFECSRKTNSDDQQLILIDLFDRGPEAGEIRYSCTAKLEDGSKTVIGNAVRTVSLAIEDAQWHRFDL
ncbi:MAG: hypothetical protein V1792_22340 [Pseudomonadota bacterium]